MTIFGIIIVQAPSANFTPHCWILRKVHEGPDLFHFCTDCSAFKRINLKLETSLKLVFSFCSSYAAHVTCLLPQLSLRPKKPCFFKVQLSPCRARLDVPHRHYPSPQISVTTPSVRLVLEKRRFRRARASPSSQGVCCLIFSCLHRSARHTSNFIAWGLQYVESHWIMSRKNI